MQIHHDFMIPKVKALAAKVGAFGGLTHSMPSSPPTPPLPFPLKFSKLKTDLSEDKKKEGSPKGT